MKKYQIIYADPPWEVWDNGKGWAERDLHYNRMDFGSISKLPIHSIVDTHCVLFLWVIFPRLQEAFEIIKAWNFTYKTVAFNWVKLNKNNMGFFIGLGHWTRANSELCLLATRGHPKRANADVPQIIATPTMTHSRKPDEIVRDRIVRLCGDLPRIELFARRKVDGWDCWGNEVENDIEL
jgi:N6-adenosine-specific RNA methylase IME4